MCKYSSPTYVLVRNFTKFEHCDTAVIEKEARSRVMHKLLRWPFCTHANKPVSIVVRYIRNDDGHGMCHAALQCNECVTSFAEEITLPFW